ncbi:HAD family acid phosphatase [bacterium]|nr:HAD family acid phosphatase [bacterium]
MLRLILLALLTRLVGAQPNGDVEIPNLDLSKRSIRSYHDSGRYAAEVEAVADRARQYLELNLPRYQGQKPAIVLDIDETSLTNYSYFDEYDFAYVEHFWKEWVNRAAATPLPGPQRLFNYARDQKVAVFFLTGRPERDRAATDLNLRRAGYNGYTRLIMRTAGYKGTTGSFKTWQRQQIIQSGYKIVLNMGDQTSDLEGGYADAVFKVPNPMYYVP